MSEGVTSFDTVRREQLIQRLYLPQIEKFYLKYYQQLDSEYDSIVILIRSFCHFGLNENGY